MVSITERFTSRYHIQRVIVNEQLKLFHAMKSLKIFMQEKIEALLFCMHRHWLSFSRNVFPCWAIGNTNFVFIWQGIRIWHSFSVYVVSLVFYLHGCKRWNKPEKFHENVYINCCFFSLCFFCRMLIVKVVQVFPLKNGYKTNNSH